MQLFTPSGGLLIVLIGIKLLPTQGGLRASLAAGFLFLVFPSALIWFGQNHKDTFAIAGFLLALFAFIRAVEGVGAHSFLANGLYFAIGLALVASMRPHLVLVYLVAFGAAFACLTGFCLLRWRLPRAKIGILPALALLVVGLACCRFG
ncbi:MAG: hypothetical protein LPJ91_00695 [Pseudazoarcus pumilus]|nr:hypothetical protein [Pseudazoarcus pumilus]